MSTTPKELPVYIERPILFSGEMVRAILDGRKTQTRRLVKLPVIDKDFGCELSGGNLASSQRDAIRHCPYGQPGDQLWVRETHWWDNAAYVEQYKTQPWLGMPDAGNAELFFRATEENPDIFPRWRPSIFMPRWASRIQLSITSVRVERLNEISGADCYAEGIARPVVPHFGSEVVLRDNARNAYRSLWESINGTGSWAKNPWVWVITFERIKP